MSIFSVVSPGEKENLRHNLLNLIKKPREKEKQLIAFYITFSIVTSTLNGRHGDFFWHSRTTN